MMYDASLYLRVHKRVTNVMNELLLFYLAVV